MVAVARTCTRANQLKIYLSNVSVTGRGTNGAKTGNGESLGLLRDDRRINLQLDGRSLLARKPVGRVSRRLLLWIVWRQLVIPLSYRVLYNLGLALINVAVEGLVDGGLVWIQCGAPIGQSPYWIFAATLLSLVRKRWSPLPAHAAFSLQNDITHHEFLIYQATGVLLSRCLKGDAICNTAIFWIASYN
jgi:hypothetical protein